MKFNFLLVLAFILTLSVRAQSVEETSNGKDSPTQSEQEEEKSALEKFGDKFGKAATETTQQVSKKLSESKERRENSDYLMLLNYSLIDLLIPSKIGFTLGAMPSADKTWEFEYLRSSISVPFIVEDLGKMTDERISLIGRSYFGTNSFNMSFGISYFDFSIHLGDKLLNRVTAGSYPSIDLVEIQAWGFNLGIGNRWSFNKNFTFGVDWISWAQPINVTNRKSAFLDYASNQQDKDDVDNAMKLVSYFPRLVFFKLQIGLLF